MPLYSRTARGKLFGGRCLHADMLCHLEQNCHGRPRPAHVDVPLCFGVVFSKQKASCSLLHGLPAHLSHLQGHFKSIWSQLLHLEGTMACNKHACRHPARNQGHAYWLFRLLGVNDAGRFCVLLWVRSDA
jgi:hypothetical protein